jgi:hypothetical protein
MLRSLYRQIVPAALLFAAFAFQANSQIFVYNQADGAGAMTTPEPSQLPITDYVQAYGPGWTIATPYTDGLLFYNGQTGLASATYLDQSGNIYIGSPYNFSSGWTQIVQSGYFLLFYNAASGLAVAGHMTENSFVQYPAVFYFSPGWTQIVATDQGSLLFYNADDGSGAVGYLKALYPGCPPNTFCDIGDVGYVQKTTYAPGYFTTGWTQVLESHYGILFYRAADGLNAMVDVDPNTGDVSTRTNSVQNLTPGWTNIVAQPATPGSTSLVAQLGSILFYNTNTGDVATGHVATGRLVYFADRGKLFMDQSFAGGFTPGFTNAAYVPWPSPPPPIN